LQRMIHFIAQSKRGICRHQDARANLEGEETTD
jgi:hypothetical protein